MEGGGLPTICWHWRAPLYDIAGADIYAENRSNLAGMFEKVKAIVGERVPICLHENGPVPDPATLGPDVDWLWFMTWHTRWLMDGVMKTPEQLDTAFGSARYLTREELPLLTRPMSSGTPG